MPDDAPPIERLQFGGFTLWPIERRLERDGQPVRIGGRSFEILVALVERAGAVVTHRELQERAWPGLAVEESALRVHIAGLRKALGQRGSAGFIANVPGRGYAFTAPIERTQKHDLAYSREHARQSPRQLPACLTRIIGRDTIIHDLALRVRQRRFVSIVGPGGIGKTTVAVATAHSMAPDFGGELFFVDLGNISEPQLIVPTIATAMGIALQSDDPITSLAVSLNGRKLLVLLDNCEHQIEDIAVVAERLFDGAPEVHILTTSREALRVEGEHVFHLSELDLPPDDPNLAAAEALQFPSVQLFMDRVGASGAMKYLDDANAPIVARICRHLDGLPLAIELVAGRVAAFGAEGIAAHIETRLKLEWRGRRTAMPRHQTLSSMLDWSYRLLSTTEQLILRRLSILRGPFDLCTAHAVAVDDQFSADDLIEGISGLITKSLLSTVMRDGRMIYRLLDVTREYACEKLAASGEADLIASRLASHMAHIFTTLAANDGKNTEDASFRIAPYLGNLRNSMDWAFTGDRDPQLGISLISICARFFLEASLFDECADWTRRALDKLAGDDLGTRRELALQENLANALMFTKGNHDDLRQALERSLVIVTALDDDMAKLRIMPALGALAVRAGDFRKAFAFGQEVAVIGRANGGPLGAILADFYEGITNHLIGNQATAIKACEAGLDRAAGHGPVPVGINWFAWTGRVHTLSSLARALWIQGMPKQATGFAEQAVDEGFVGKNPIKRCVSVIYSMHVHIWSGDFVRADHLIEQLIDYAQHHGLVPYHAVAVGLLGELRIRQGQTQAGVDLLRKALRIMERVRHLPQEAGFKAVLADALSLLGQFGPALAAADEAIASIGRGGNSHDLPEILRIKGLVLSRMSGDKTREAEVLLLHALNQARGQGDLGWELRIACTLFDLMVKQDRIDQAKSMLAGAYAKFTEGFETLDLREARRRLDLGADRQSVLRSPPSEEHGILVA